MGTHKHHNVLIVLSLLVLPLSIATADVTTGLFSHWKLDDGAGSVAADSAGGNDGTLQGDASWAEGYIGGAILLDGNGDYIDCGKSDTFNTLTDAITLAAWVQARGDFSYPDWSGIIMRGGPNTDTFALYYHKGSNRLGFKTTGTNPNNWVATATGSAAAIFDGDWHHVAATYDGKAKTIYLDGASLASMPSSGTIEASTGRVLLGAGRDTAAPTHLTAGRIDDARIYKRALSAGDVKELIPAKLQAYNPAPADGAVNVLGIGVIFSWKAGDTALLHNIYIGADPNLDETDLARPKYNGTTLIDPRYMMLEPGTTYYWRVDEVEKDMVTVHTGNVWSFMTQALGAYLPNPADGAVEVSTTPMLTWLPGQQAFQHHVYFGDNFDAVNLGAADADKGLLPDPNFAPGGLEPLTTYYWRVDQVLIDDTVRTGETWSFTTHLPVDDFESYSDEMGKRVFQTWIDGIGYSEPVTVAGNGSGAVVGLDAAPWVEQKIVHSGKQSMPMAYDNTGAPYYSEAERTFAPLANWMLGDVDTLVLWVRGKSTNAPAPLYVAIEDSSRRVHVVTCPEPATISSIQWARWPVPLADFHNAGVNLAAVKKLSIGVGSRNATTPGGAGSLYIDDIYLIKAATEQ